MLRLQVAGHVRAQVQPHGGVLILDTAGGEWLALNATSGDLWRAWQAGTGIEQGVHEIAARYPGVPEATIRADAERVAAELVDRGILTLAANPAVNRLPASESPSPFAVGCPVPAPPAGRPAPGVAALMAEAPSPPAAGGRRGARRVIARLAAWSRGGLALYFLIAACLIVRCSPFRAQLWLVRATRRRWCRRPAEPGQAAAVVAAVGWAVRRYPGRAACLEQSLAAVLLAAARRRRLDWCLGAAADPYRFHAWVELDGEPVLAPDGPQSLAGYVRMLTA